MTKLGERSEQGVFVGRCNTQNASRILIPEKKIIVSKDIKVDEQELYREINKNPLLLTNELLVIDIEDNFMDIDQTKPRTNPSLTDNILNEVATLTVNPSPNKYTILPELSKLISSLSSS